MDKPNTFAAGRDGHRSTLRIARLYALHRIAKRSFARHISQAQHKIKPAAVIGMVAFPAFYVVWTLLIPQPYESAVARLIGFLLCAGLYWDCVRPGLLGRHHVAFTYVTLGYVVPFFFTFMMLMNGANAVWQMSALTGFVYLMLLCDVINAIILGLAGSLAAYLVYATVSGTLMVPAEYISLLPVLAFLTCGVAFLNYSDSLVLKARMATVGTLAAHIAHEMRTPLLGIKLDADKLTRVLPALLDAHDWARDHDWPRRLPGAQREGLLPALDRITQHATSANVIIDMLLMNAADGSRLVHSDTCSARRIIDTALERYNFRGDQRAIIDVAAGTDFAFQGSEILMVHVLFNLLKNSLRAIERQGHGRISIHTQPGDRWHRLVFRDTGHGMSREAVRHIFAPFYSGEAAGIGTGIGLAFCASVVEQSGGSIACTSQIGTGTTFTISLPAGEANPPSPGEARAASAS